jgi:hypothetical protein
MSTVDVKLAQHLKNGGASLEDILSILQSVPASPASSPSDGSIAPSPRQNDPEELWLSDVQKRFWLSDVQKRLCRSLVRLGGRAKFGAIRKNAGGNEIPESTAEWNMNRMISMKILKRDENCYGNYIIVRDFT